MASLDNGHNVVPRFIDVPGQDRTVGIWRIKALSSSDTVTVPELDSVGDAADESSVRVLEPATGVTATAAETTSNNENVVTIEGATIGQDLILLTVHAKGKHNALAVPVASASGSIAADHTNSLDFDGLSEFISSAAQETYDADLGLSNKWTWGLWFKNLSTDPESKELFLIETPDTGINRVFVYLPVVDATNSNIQIQLTDDAGNFFKSMIWENVVTRDEWVSFFFSFDGTLGSDQLQVYINGSLTAPTTIATDDVGTMSDSSDSQLIIGGDVFNDTSLLFEGRFYEAAAWNKVLSASEILTLHANDVDLPPLGNQDLSTDHGNYTSSASLKHWYRLGVDAASVGKDFGNSPVNLDVSTNLDADDIDPDYPQGGSAPVLTPASISFNGSNEIMSTGAANTPTADLDLADAWTWGVWVKMTDTSTPTQALMSRQSGVGSEIYFSIDGVDVNSATLRLNVTSFDGGASKQYEFIDVLDINTWYHIAATYNEAATGAQLIVYLDGVALVPDAIGADDELVMIDEVSQVTFGANASFSGVTAAACLIFESYMWAFPLSAAEIAFLASNPAVDILTDSFPPYNHASVAYHWWRFGYDPDNLGEDFGAIPIAPLTTLSNIDATDISADVPT